MDFRLAWTLDLAFDMDLDCDNSWIIMLITILLLQQIRFVSMVEMQNMSVEQTLEQRNL